LSVVGAAEPAEQYKRELMVSHFARHRFAREQRADANISNKKKIMWMVQLHHDIGDCY
jgi:hypothetical protein